MGVWGVGLYSSDFALDLRSSVKAVARLPYDADRLLEYLVATERSAAHDATDSDHTIFWLTVAEQFAKRGINCARARDKALAIIRDGTDLAAMKALGMDEKSLVKRGVMLEGLRARIAAPIETGKRRPVLKAPQKLLLEVGEVLTYPVCGKNPINPYVVGKQWEWLKKWRQDGWGAFVVVERGLEFEFLSWYRPLVICEPLPEEPTLAILCEPRMWLLRNPGTLTARHSANMHLKSLGRILIDADKLYRCFPKRSLALAYVVSDISISNSLDVRSLGANETHRIQHGQTPTPQIHVLTEVANLGA